MVLTLGGSAFTSGMPGGILPEPHKIGLTSKLGILKVKENNFSR